MQINEDVIAEEKTKQDFEVMKPKLQRPFKNIQ
jgi:hypothetical protein